MLRQASFISSIPDLLPEDAPEYGADHAADKTVLYVVPPPRNLTVRRWQNVTVHTFTRPAGESIVRVPYIRLLLPRHPQERKITLRLDGGRAREFHLGAISLFPRDATTHVVSGKNEIIHIFHEPKIYRQAAEDIGISRETNFDFVPNLNDPRIVELCSMLALEAERPGFGERLLVEGLSYALAINVLRRLAGIVVTPPRGLSSARLGRVTDFIEAHIAESELSLHALAAVACLSTYQFGRSFKHSTGQTPHQFVLMRRIDRAKSLLREGRLSLSEIATVSGFADQAHFGNRFRQVVGTTPRQYRLAAA